MGDERNGLKRPRLALHDRRGLRLHSPVEPTKKLRWHRWAVKRMLPLLSQYRWMKIRCERGADFHQVLLGLGCALICENTFSSFVGRI